MEQFKKTVKLKEWRPLLFLPTKWLVYRRKFYLYLAKSLPCYFIAAT